MTYSLWQLLRDAYSELGQLQVAEATGGSAATLVDSKLTGTGKNPLEDLGPKSVGLRTRVGTTLRARGAIASVATVAGHLMSYIIMLASLRFLGVDSSSVDWVELLVAYAIVMLLTALPLTPGGIGVAAVGYTAVLAPGNPALANLIASASLLTRVFTWMLPIAVGIVPLVRWKRQETVIASSAN